MRGHCRQMTDAEMSGTEEIKVTSRVVASPDQVSADLGGEAAILSFNTGLLYGLDDVGVRIWNLIQEPQLVADVRDVLLAEYDVSRTVLERDLLHVLNELREQELIAVER